MTREELFGIAMATYYGGRAECRIRRAVVPVVYLDFLSVYPTVNSRMQLGRLLTAESIEVVEATEAVRRLLHSVTVDRCFDPKLWRQLRFFAQVVPEGDVLPVRARYDPSGENLNIGINPLSSERPLWYAGPDVVASTLLTGKPPKVLRAIRLKPKGRRKELRTVRLRDRVSVNPRTQDFFQVWIEARKGLKNAADLTPEERERLDTFLKVLANAGSYGIFAEMNRAELPASQDAEVTVFGIDGSFTCRTRAPETPGQFCFPPIAAPIPAAARLMLALLERCVTDAGGTYAFCDTDSMAIVATESGGLVACPGGSETLPDGTPAVRALSWAQVDAIVKRFEALNPYDKAIVPGSILKIEGENFTDGQREQLYAYAIAAKRYALFDLRPDGSITLRKHSEHGLGHLLNPTDPENPSRDWIAQLWTYLISEALGRPIALPSWLDRPAVSRLTVSSPWLLRPFAPMQKGKPYPEQIKPMNFILSAHVAAFGHPDDIDPSRFHLVAPHTTDPRQWTKIRWTDVYSGRRYSITTTGEPSKTRARGKSYREVLETYPAHPEPKSTAPDGGPCGRDTVGLLDRRPVHVLWLEYIGKESNRLEDVAHGMVHNLDEVLETYVDPKADPWTAVILPVLKTIPLAELARGTGLSERTVRALRNGRARPSPAARDALVRIAVEHATCQQIRAASSAT
jgi:hypothetical protein